MCTRLVGERSALMCNLRAAAASSDTRIKDNQYRGGGISARNKGKRGEGEVARILQAVLDKAFLDAFCFLGVKACPSGDAEVLRMIARQKMLELKSGGGAGGDSALRILRNTLQAAKGGCDLAGTPGLSVEVKTSIRLSMPAWSRQTVQQAARHTIPVLWYKVLRSPWRCRIFMKNSRDVSLYADFDYKEATDWTYHFWYGGITRDVWRMLD